MANEKPMAFHDLPASMFPFTIEYLNAKGVVLRTETVEGPGVMEVPGLAQFYGPITIRVTHANGTQTTTGPDGATR